MRQSEKKLAGFQFNEEADRKRLSDIFRDTLVIDAQLRVVFASHNLLEVLGHDADEIHNNSLRNITSDDSLIKAIKVALDGQPVNKQNYLLTDRTGKQLVFTIEGVKVGSKDNADERLMLRAKPQQQSPLSKTFRKGETVEQFIYQAAHDLRGPLATIKGLVNLLKMRTSAEEVDKLVHLIDVHANALDERLFQLSYLNQSYHEKETPTFRLRFSTMETRLRKILEKNAFIDFLELQFASANGSITPIDETAVYRIAEHLLLHLISLPTNMNHCIVKFDVHKKGRHLVIEITGRGFESCKAQYQIITQNEFNYIDVFQHPELMNLFSAKKLGMRMKAEITLTEREEGTQQITLRIPLSAAQ